MCVDCMIDVCFVSRVKMAKYHYFIKFSAKKYCIINKWWSTTFSSTRVHQTWVPYFLVPPWHGWHGIWVFFNSGGYLKFRLVLEPMKLEYCMVGTRVHQTRVSICIWVQNAHWYLSFMGLSTVWLVPESTKLGYQSVLPQECIAKMQIVGDPAYLSWNKNPSLA